MLRSPAGSSSLNTHTTFGGQLKSYKDPYGEEITYANDKAGRLTAVIGSSCTDGFTNYASGATYRSWADGLKHLDYANGVDMDMTYNDRLQPATYDLVKNTTDIMKKNYEYAGDGSLKFVEDDMNGIFDRLNLYDHAGRVKVGKSSTEASGTTVTSNQDTQLPYRQTFTHNAFNNMTARDNLHWGVDYWNGVSNNLSYTYANNRITNSYWQYDADACYSVFAPR